MDIMKTASVVCLLVFLATQVKGFDSSSRFFRRHRCQISESTINDGFVSFTAESIECSDLSPSIFTDAICPETCRNPITGLELDNHYVAEAVRYQQQLFSQLDGEIYFLLTASCRCISRNHDEM